MCAEKVSHPGLINAVLGNKCPRCRRGNLFLHPNPYHLSTTMHMPEHCAVCGQKFELQTGFYFGTGFVSYGITVGILAVTFLAWWFTIGMGIHDNRVVWWLISSGILLVLLQPPIQRLARSIWIAFFVRYDHNWDTASTGQ